MGNVNAQVVSNGMEKISTKNLIFFSLGTLGRDFLYNFFNTYLLSFILFTKHLTTEQFASISIIIIVARIFDALNDPIMGGIVENTRTKWGKYKPWQLIGTILTGIVVAAIFWINLDQWAFIGFLAFGYLMFSITFTMNDISYWGMMPSLTSDPHSRNKLTSFSQIVASIGGGAVGLLVPLLTTGSMAFLGAVNGFKALAIAAGVLMFAFQCFTLFGVKEKPLDPSLIKQKRMTLKDMFKVIFKNDQLLWAALIMLIFNIGTNVVGGGLSMSYIYFEFGYEGILLTLFAIGFSAASVIFTLTYPWLSKKFGRDKLVYTTGLCIIIGYLLVMIMGLAVPSSARIAKFAVMAVFYTIPGFGAGFYTIMFVNIANTVEYNEYKTGKREEGLIFSLRPFTAKMGSALMQGLVMVVYIVAGVLNYTNGISDVENAFSAGLITEAQKMEQINAIIGSVSTSSKQILLVCMCLIPAVFLAVALIIYKKKFILNESTLDAMMKETASRKEQQLNVSEDLKENIVEEQIAE